MGSLQPAHGLSQYPSFVVAVAWENVIVRYLWLAGAFLNIGLLAWVTVIAPGIQRIPLGFTPTGAPQETVPGVQLILLPVLSALLFVVGLLAGLFFYRRPDQRILALVVWASGVITAFCSLLAVFFLITTPV